MPYEQFVMMENKAKKTIIVWKILAVVLVLAMASVSLVTLINEKPELAGEVTVEEKEIIEDEMYNYVFILPFNKEMSSGEIELRCWDEDDIEYKDAFSLERDGGNSSCLTVTVKTDFKVKDNYWEYNVVSATSQDQSSSTVIFVVFLLPLSVISTLVLVGALTMDVKVYRWKNFHVMVYCGCIRHQLVIDGMCVAKTKNLLPFSFSDIRCDFEGDRYLVKITKTNMCSLYVNNELRIPEGSEKNAKENGESKFLDY